MQPTYTAPNSGKIAFRYGLIFGLIQAVVAIAILLLNTFVNTTSDKVGIAFLLAAVNFLLSLAAYFVAGILSSKQTGKVSTGTLAGMWTGIIYGVVNLVVALVVFFQVSLPRLMQAAQNSNSPVYTNNPDAFRVGLMIGGVGIPVLGALIAVGLGAGLGALGGLIGKNTSKVQPEPAYPAYPSAYPPYPGQPGSYPPPSAPGQPYPGQPVQYPPTINADQSGFPPYREQ